MEKRISMDRGCCHQDSAASVAQSGSGPLICFDLLLFRLPSVTFDSAWRQLAAHGYAFKKDPTQLGQFRLKGTSLNMAQLSVCLGVPATRKLNISVQAIECGRTNHPVHLACWLKRPRCLKTLLEQTSRPFLDEGFVTLRSLDPLCTLLPVESVKAEHSQYGTPEDLAFKARCLDCLYLIADHARRLKAENIEACDKRKWRKLDGYISQLRNENNALLFSTSSSQNKENADARSLHPEEQPDKNFDDAGCEGSTPEDRTGVCEDVDSPGVVSEQMESPPPTELPQMSAARVETTTSFTGASKPQDSLLACAKVAEDDLVTLCELFASVAWQPTEKCTLACFPMSALISAASKGKLCPNALEVIASHCSDNQISLVYLSLTGGIQGAMGGASFPQEPCSCSYREFLLDLEGTELQAALEVFRKERTRRSV